MEEVSSSCFHIDCRITVELVSSDILEELCKLPMRLCDIPWEVSHATHGQGSARGVVYWLYDHACISELSTVLISM